ncbi:tRNA preQ1(34) S-adenosylmethionine ribosyltransferase-isomerase QueA [bacterium]|nr:tRNA preQ1(34) S-adenosylmethionine ribosyltransferase-isomerase QueA [bacterium]
MCKNFLNHSAIPPEYDLATYDYPLPEDRIAQFPAEPRDSSKLLVVRPGAPPEEIVFRRITDYLSPGDLMVFNNTRVFPARLYGRKRTGARIEFLLLQNLGEKIWQVMARPARRLHPDDIVDFEGHLSARIVSKNPDGSLVVEFNLGGENFWRVLDRMGHIPLPLYIRRPDTEYDRTRYQTIYASERGAVAAPTAGLHFTAELLQKIRRMGVETAFITLHIGWGTFKPIEVRDIRKHKMHREYCKIPPETAEAINLALAENRRIIAVGTTTVRALESAAAEGIPIKPGERWTGLFIYPGFEFHVVNCMVTNFHLPKSSLIVMVSAFAGIDTIKSAYKYALEHNFRFYSYGDAMFIARK